MTKEKLQEEAAGCLEQIIQAARKLVKIEEQFYQVRQTTKKRQRAKGRNTNFNEAEAPTDG